MKQTNINIDEIKRYPTVTNPIKADDLHTPQAYAYTLRRAIVTDCTTEQRAELVELLDGKDTAEGVTFNNTRVNRDRLHIWQNEQSRKERAAILGEGWEYVSGLHHHTKPGDLVTCVDGTRGRVTKASGESCVIEFETEDGRRLSIAGYFHYTPSEKLRNSESNENRNQSYNQQDHERETCGRIERRAAMGETVTREECQQVVDYHRKHGGRVPDAIREGAKVDVDTLETSSEIKADADKAEPSSWMTDFTADDFQKLTSRYEVADEDRDIMGRRFRSTVGPGELQVFVSDYAGNERHALYYIWDEWMREVRANVRPLDFLRQMLTEVNKWEPVAA